VWVRKRAALALYSGTFNTANKEVIVKDGGGRPTSGQKIGTVSQRRVRVTIFFKAPGTAGGLDRTGKVPVGNEETRKGGGRKGQPQGRLNEYAKEI